MIAWHLGIVQADGSKVQETAPARRNSEAQPGDILIHSGAPKFRDRG
jgi:hypothetical protein